MEGDPLPCMDAIQVHSEGVADLLSNILTLASLMVLNLALTPWS